jgi:hypothetical protein
VSSDADDSAHGFKSWEPVELGGSKAKRWESEERP